MIENIFLVNTTVTIEFADGTKDKHELKTFNEALELFDYIGEKYDIPINYDLPGTNITPKQYADFKRKV